MMSFIDKDTPTMSCTNRYTPTMSCTDNDTSTMSCTASIGFINPQKSIRLTVLQKIGPKLDLTQMTWDECIQKPMQCVSWVEPSNWHSSCGEYIVNYFIGHKSVFLDIIWEKLCIPKRAFPNLLLTSMPCLARIVNRQPNLYQSTVSLSWCLLSVQRSLEGQHW